MIDNALEYYKKHIMKPYPIKTTYDFEDAFKIGRALVWLEVGRETTEYDEAGEKIQEEHFAKGFAVYCGGAEITGKLPNIVIGTMQIEPEEKNFDFKEVEAAIRAKVGNINYNA